MEVRGVGACVCLLVLVGFASATDSDLLDDSNEAAESQDMILEQMTSILDRIASLDQMFHTFQDRLSAMDDGIISLNQRVGHLTEKVDTLVGQGRGGAAQVMQDLEAVCAGLGSSSNAATTSPTPETTPATVKEYTDIPFALTRVNKSEKGDVRVLTLEYHATSTPDVQLSGYYDESVTLYHVTATKVVEVEVPQAVMARYVMVIFVCVDASHNVVLNLMSEVSIVSLPLVNFKVAQGSGVTFASGQNVSVDFDLKVERDGDDAIIARNSTTCTVLVESDTDSSTVNSYYPFYSPYPSPVMVNMSEREVDPAHVNGTVTFLQTPRNDTEGILEFHVVVQFDCSDAGGCLVRSLRSVHGVRFYREDHNGPFPLGFIGFVNQTFLPDSTHVVCATNRGRCYLHCRAVSNGPVTVNVRRMNDSGASLSLPQASSQGTYWGSARVNIHDVRFSDAGQYLCVAASHETGSTVVQTLSLHVVQAPDIDPEESNVTHHADGSLSVTCLAQGIPAPSVTFEYYINNVTYSGPDNPDVTVTGSDVTTRAVLLVDDPEDASYLTSVTCIASNVDPSSPYSDRLAARRRLYFDPRDSYWKAMDYF